MIISHTHKYIFIGLPFSASSAISRELLNNYSGEPLYHKHANIPVFIKLQPELDLKNILFLQSQENPQDILFTSYNKYLSNAYDKFTDPKKFAENGGFVSKKERALYKKIKVEKWSFDEFLQKKYPLLPYDNNLSINRNYLNGIIQFNNLLEDFNQILKKIGIAPVRDLPVYNKTKKLTETANASPKLVNKIIGPFIHYNRNSFPKEVQSVHVDAVQKAKFLLLHKLRTRKINAYDMRQHNNNSSIEELKKEL